MDVLAQHLINTWSVIQQSVIDHVVRCLNVCVKAEDAFFIKNYRRKTPLTLEWMYSNWQFAKTIIFLLLIAIQSKRDMSYLAMIYKTKRTTRLLNYYFKKQTIAFNSRLITKLTTSDVCCLSGRFLCGTWLATPRTAPQSRQQQSTGLRHQSLQHSVILILKPRPHQQQYRSNKVCNTLNLGVTCLIETSDSIGTAKLDISDHMAMLTALN